MKVATCSIVKQENKYIREFVEYNKSIGFDNVIIYDHNEGDENLYDVIGDYIDCGYVKLIDWSGHKMGPAVKEAFQDCINKYKHKGIYDWILFIDNDEFLTLNKDNNVKEYLSRDCFKDVDIIKINWLCMSDNDLIYYEDKPLNERFTKPCSDNPEYFSENRHIKSFININSKYIDLIDYINGSAHCPCRNYNGQRNNGKWINEFKIVNNTGIQQFEKDQYYESKLITINFDLAYLKHFRFKTIEEHCKNKLSKLTFCGYNSCNFNLKLFYKYNNPINIKTKYFNNYITKLFNIKVALIVYGNLSKYHAKEFFDHYIYLCVDKIFYGYYNEENFKNNILPIINKNDIIDYRYSNSKKDFIDDIYNEGINNYDWIIVANAGDYLELSNDISIKSFLYKYNNYGILQIRKYFCGLNDIRHYFNGRFDADKYFLLEDTYRMIFGVANHDMLNIINSKFNSSRKEFNINNGIYCRTYPYKGPNEYVEEIVIDNNGKIDISKINNYIKAYLNYINIMVKSHEENIKKYINDHFDGIKEYFYNGLLKAFNKFI